MSYSIYCARCTESSQQIAAAFPVCSWDWREGIIQNQGLENKKVLEGDAGVMGMAQVSRRETRDLVSQEKLPDLKSLDRKCLGV